MNNFCNSKIIEIDLSSKKHSIIEIPDSWFQAFFSGSGLGIRYLFEKRFHDIEPLSPLSPIFFVKGLFTGTKVPSSSKTSVCGRSPLTGIWNESTGGGYWGAELAFTGYEGMVIHGRSEKPVYIMLTDETVEVRDASHIWGLDTFQTFEILKKENGKDAKIASIGIAGELCVLFASIIFDGPDSRSVGRGGMGAVMGSKNLKSIVLRGNKRPIPDNHNALMEQLKKEIPLMLKKTQGLRAWSTAGGVETIEFLGDLPVKNWQLGSFEEGAKKIAGQSFLPKTLDHHHTCYSCAIRCSKILNVNTDIYSGIYGHGPEYETIAGFGSNLLNDDPMVIIAANDICNRLGMDTISTSAVIAFAMEAYEKRLLPKSLSGDLELEWGNGKSILELTRSIGNRNSELGRILGEGVRKASIILGPATSGFAIHCKGMEFPYHDPRAFTCMSGNYATANRGACHLESLSYFLSRGVSLPELSYTTAPDPHTSEGKGEVAYKMQNFMSVFNPLGLCKFLIVAGVGPSVITEWLNLITGWNFDYKKLMTTGERIFNLKRIYNNMLGITKKDDRLPDRFVNEPRPSGRAKDILPDTEKILKDYYHFRGWDDDSGKPNPGKIRELDLEELVTKE